MSGERVVYRDRQYEERTKCAFCLAFVPCTMCCGIPLLLYLTMKGPSGPPDAVGLSDEETKLYIDRLQGVQYNEVETPKRISFKSF